MRYLFLNSTIPHTQTLTIFTIININKAQWLGYYLYTIRPKNCHFYTFHTFGHNVYDFKKEAKTL